MTSHHDGTQEVTFRLNGEERTYRVSPRTHLVDFLRDSVGLVGTRVGCEHGVCGACTVRINGLVARGCLVLPIQLGGADVWTVEGLSDSGELRGLQDAFHQFNAVQCGFCTSGMLVTACQLVGECRSSARPTRDDIRVYLSGNMCRCTGYQAIVDAVESVLDGGELASHD